MATDLSFINYALTKSTMLEARRIKSNLEMASIKIQKEIAFAAEHGRGEVIIHTYDFMLDTKARQTITANLQEAGYRYKWRSCGEESERIHIWWEWEDENV